LRRWDAVRIEEEAHRIKQPTLLIWGADDPEIPLAHGRKLFEEIRGARLFVFTDCGHMPMEEYPREFAEVVTVFCRMKAMPDDERRTMDKMLASIAGRQASAVS
jgi:pimeloyl-ACP methyl ester carboxylesterase